MAWTLNMLIFIAIVVVVVGCGGMHVKDSNHVLSQLKDCDVENLVLITDGSPHRSKLNVAITRYLSENGVVFVHYVMNKNTINDDITQILQRHTLDQHDYHTTFVLTTSRFDDVFKSANNYSKENIVTHRGHFWLHSTRWLVITERLQEFQHFATTHNDIPMDNVAVFALDSSSVSYRNTNVSKNVRYILVYTLMWKENRTRKLDKILIPEFVPDTTNPAHHDRCAIFPNILNHLNGRRLAVITKVHWGFLVYIDVNPVSGEPEYQGFILDILHSLASSLNFTFTITPYPALDKQPSWDDVVDNVTSGEADFSATLWSYSWMDIHDISMMYPVLIDTFTGAYRRPKPSDEYISLYILCPFHPFTYIFLFSSLIHTLIIYVIIVEVFYSNENNIIPQNPFNAERRKSKYLSRKLSNTVKPPAKCKETFKYRLRKLAWSLAASVLNQAYLPRPEQMSARLLLFLWSISMVIFYAIYTGSLTAEMVNVNDADMLTNFENLVNSNKYKWGTTDGSIIDNVMENKSDGGVLELLNQKKQNIPDGLNGDVYFSLKDKMEVMEYNFVLIHFKVLLNQIIGLMDHPEDFVMIQESLLPANQGMIMSKNSEMRLCFSKYIEKMHQSGVISQMYEKYAHGNRTASPMLVDDPTQNRKTLTLNNIRWPLIIIMLLVWISIVVLIIEKLWHPVGKWRSST